MRFEDLKPGFRYRLTTDVNNPNLDRRERYSLARLAWTKGDVFRVVQWGSRPAIEPVMIQATPRHATGSLHTYDDGFDALVAALEPVGQMPSDICRLHGFDPLIVLTKLHQYGHVSLDQIEATCAAMETEPDKGAP